MRRSTFLVSLAVLAAAASASAEPPPQAHRRLTYTIPPELPYCPNEAHFRQQVRLRMTYDPFDAGGSGSGQAGPAPRPPLQPDATEAVSVSITRRGTTLVARIDLLDASGGLADRREFSSPDTLCACWSLVTDAAVAVAFAMTPFSPPPAPPAPAPPPGPFGGPAECPASPGRGPHSPPSVPPPHHAPPHHAPEKKIEPIRLQGGAGGLLATGISPRAQWGGFAFGEVRWSWLSAAMQARVLLPDAAAPEHAVPITVGLTSAAFIPCAHFGISFACVLGEVGSLHVDSDIPTMPDDRALFAALGGRLGVEIPISHNLSLRLHTEVLGALTQMVMKFDERAVWDLPLISGSVGAGLAMTR